MRMKRRSRYSATARPLRSGGVARPITKPDSMKNTMTARKPNGRGISAT
jgi:hypothetical protein